MNGIPQAYKIFCCSMLLLLFIVKGIVTVLPVLQGDFNQRQQEEMPVSSAAEKSEESSPEKIGEIKEFLGGSFTNLISAPTITYLIENSPAFIVPDNLEVFLSVTTPPPKHFLL